MDSPDLCNSVTAEKSPGNRMLSADEEGNVSVWNPASSSKRWISVGLIYWILMCCTSHREDTSQKVTNTPTPQHKFPAVLMRTTLPTSKQPLWAQWSGFCLQCLFGPVPQQKRGQPPPPGHRNRRGNDGAAPSRLLRRRPAQQPQEQHHILQHSRCK